MEKFIKGALLLAVLLHVAVCDGDQGQAPALPGLKICPLRPCILPADCQLVIPPNPSDPCACPTCALDCSTVLCAAPTCPNPVTPKGQCCPVCPKPTDPPIDCSLVRCLFPTDCPNPEVPEGQCCPVCPKPTGPPDCSAVLCLRPDCLNPVIPEGECCGVCPEEPTESCPIEGQVYKECGTACPPTCGEPAPKFCTLQCVVGCQCPAGTILDTVANRCVKKCSPVICPLRPCILPVDCQLVIPPDPSDPCACPTCGDLDCSLVDCAVPPCPNHVTPKGQCCPVCPDCSAVLCLRPDCPNPVFPEGECCGVCPEEPTESCPIEGQVYKECGTACPPTCGEPAPKFCTLQCVVGCQCPAGTVLDTVANRCVKKCSPVICPLILRPCILPVDCQLVIPPDPSDPCACPTCGDLDCSLVDCAAPPCPNPVTPKGQCCPVCPDCSAVLCLRPDCPNPVFPEGECCGVCPEEPTDAEPSCPIEGQVYMECGTACPPTCAEPGPKFCTLQCVVGCQCPAGTVLDEVANRCVPVKKCTCPPDCTRDFCVSNPRARCNIPGPREIPGCFGQCQLTFCKACYFSEDVRDLPGDCGDCGSPVTSISCLRRWSRCIRRADIRENGKPDPSCITQDKFKCYRYPCQLRG